MTASGLNQQAWRWLDTELDRWQQAGLVAEFWWRDDDAVSPGVELEQLLALSGKLGLPVSLAVIPAVLEPELALRLRGETRVSVLQHGYAHRNHAPEGALKLEIGGTRPVSRLLDDLATGRERLAGCFEDRFVPVLVPPWNRIDTALLASLPGIGLGGISTMKARGERFPAPGLLQANAHLDPIAWRQGGGFIGLYPAIGVLMQHLIARRLGYRDRGEPTGILTHHLVQNPTTWSFVEDLFERVRSHPAARVVGAGDIWNPGQP